MSFKNKIKVENCFNIYNNENDIMDVNKFVINTLEELKIENKETVSENLNCNGSSTFEVMKINQASDISQKIKLEPGFSYNVYEKSSSTPISFSHSINQNISKENINYANNYAKVGHYKIESSQSNIKSEINHHSGLLNISPEIQQGNTSRLLDLWESPKDLTTNEKKNNNVEQVGAVPKKKINLYDRLHVEEDNVFQLGRQKGIRDILASLVSPYSPSAGPTKFNYENTVDSPDLTLSFLEKENLKLLNKLATSSSPITKSGSITNFEDTSNIYAGNVSKEETRVYSHGHNKEKKTKRVDVTLELEDQIKIWLKPFYNTDVITKEDYKRIMLKCIKKISCWKGEDKTPVTIRRLVEFYIKKNRMDKSNLKSTKKTRKATSNDTFSNENSLLEPKFLMSKNLQEDLSNKSSFQSTNLKNKKSKATDSERQTNIKINIKHSCCKKDSLNNDSHKIVISRRKSNEVRWRY